MRVDVPTLQALADIATPDSVLPAGRGVAFHSDRVREGDVFFALPGAAGHGLRFADEALRKGAVFVVSDRPHPRGIVVGDPAALLLALGRAARSALKCAVVGVTGSAGKTTTKAMLKATLGADASPGNLNTPFALARTLVDAAVRDDGTKPLPPLVLELGIDRIGEMDELLELTRPDHAVLTSIAPSHLEGLGNVATVAREKARLLGAAPGVRLAAWDTLPALASLLADTFPTADAGGEAAPWSTAPFPFGVTPYRVVDADGPDRDRADAPEGGWEGGRDGSLDGSLDGGHTDPAIAWRSDVAPDGQTLTYEGATLRLPWPGRAMAANALAALVMAERLGVDTSVARQRLLEAELEPARLQRLRLGAIAVLDDTYNSNPASAALALEVLKSSPAPRVAVLGDMLELGPQSPRFHRELGEATRDLDLVIAVGPAAAALLRGNPSALHAPDIEAAALLLDRIPATGTVLFKASRGVGLERLLSAFASLRSTAGAA